MKAGSRRLGNSMRFLALSYSTSVAAILAVGCGGSGSFGPPPPLEDFSLSVSPSAMSMTVGTISPPVVISVVGQNGFSGAVSVAITGLPPGATAFPASTLALPTIGSGQALIFIPPATPTGSLSIEFNATSGSQSHSATLTLVVTPVSDTAVLQDASGQATVGTIEFQGLSAGAFNPNYWQKNTLNWVPDVRMPMLAPKTTGPYQNIYAPWPLEQASGWRLFYGGWDGQDVPFDQIFSVTTTDFLTFANHDHIISNGDFLNVNNVNVQHLPDGSLHMICTGGQPGNLPNFPVYFSSPDGVTWNDSPEPYSAALKDVVSIQGYALFSSGNFNGANVLLRDNGAWVLYFTDWQNDPHTTYRATASTLPNFQLQGAALKTDHAVNDVKKFTINGTSLYLMGLHNNDQSLRYSLSNDGVSFGPEQTLFIHLLAQDQYIVAIGFVTRGSELLGVLYGAGAVETLDQNRIFARWLQKKVVITDSSGVQYFTQGGYGPDRQWFPAPARGTLEGTMVVYAEDGVTPLGSSFVTLTSGMAYTLVLR
jgi:hypothetical protein